MNPDMRIAYIAGPYRSPRGPADHWTVKQHIYQAEDYARFIAKACGGRVHCHVPQAATAFWSGPDVDEQQWLDGCLALIRRLDPARDALLILPGSEKSAGTSAEFDLAKSMGLPIWHLPEERRLLHVDVLRFWLGPSDRNRAPDGSLGSKQAEAAPMSQIVHTYYWCRTCGTPVRPGRHPDMWRQVDGEHEHKMSPAGDFHPVRRFTGDLIRPPLVFAIEAGETEWLVARTQEEALRYFAKCIFGKDTADPMALMCDLWGLEAEEIIVRQLPKDEIVHFTDENGEKREMTADDLAWHFTCPSYPLSTSI